MSDLWAVFPSPFPFFPSPFTYPNISASAFARGSFEFVDGHTVEAVLAAGFLDGPHDHPPYERGDPLHALGRLHRPTQWCRSIAGPYERVGGLPARREKWGPGELPGMWCRGGLQPSDRRSCRRPGRGSPHNGRSSRTLRIARRAKCGGECRRTAPMTSRVPRDSSCEESPRRRGGRGKG